MEINNPSPESQELIQELAKVNVSNIYTVRFFPNDRPRFNVMTENMKRIAIIIVNKLGKTTFEPNELKHVYDFIQANLPNYIGAEQRKVIENAIKGFVEKGGKVKIVTKIAHYAHIVINIILAGITGIGIFLALCGGFFLWIGNSTTSNIWTFWWIGIVTLVVMIIMNYMIGKGIKAESVDILYKESGILTTIIMRGIIPILLYVLVTILIKSFF